LQDEYIISLLKVQSMPLKSAVQNDFLLNPDITFLNHGSFGATPRPVFDAYQNWQRELEKQPVEFIGRRAAGLLAFARSELATFLGTSAENLVFVTNATTGLNIVARSLNLSPGDEVLTSDHEYGAINYTWMFLSGKRGFKYINHVVPMPFTTPQAWLDSFWSGVTPRTKVIFISHITSPTAAIFPVAELCHMARQAGILTVIDGAHVPGQLPLSLDSLGADFYSGNLHKWLCSPKGSAFLYARPEVQCTIEPLVVSWGYIPGQPSNTPMVDYFEYLGTRDISTFLAVPDAIQYHQQNLGGEARQRCHQLAVQTVQRITALTGLPSIYSNDAWFAQMVACPLPPGTSVEQVKIRLYDEFSIEIPLIPWPGTPLIRTSFQAYNTQQHLEQLVSALEIILK
jgi:isopenicillin-N epimerase